ncbi:hypothetical protein N9S30_00465 [bacterium]|nr:hypothetical protein [bacterium]
MGSKKYWNDLFPLDDLFSLWSLHSNDFRKREIALKAKCRGDKDEYFKRHVSVGSTEELKKELKRHALTEIHVGSVYTKDCHLVKSVTSNCVSVGRELVLDLDIQDKSVFCAVSKDDLPACDAAMKTLLLSANILRAALRELFGFKLFLFSYSGRRGLHISVLDKRAFDLTAEARSAIITRLTAPVFKHDPRLLFDVIATDPSFGKETKSAIDVAHHQLLKRRDQGGVGLLQLQRDRNKFLDILFDPSLLRKQFGVDLAASTRRAAIGAADGEACLAAITKRVSTSRFFSSRLKLILFSIVWPVLDAGASRDGHLLKSEFSINGNTDRIAVPFELRHEEPVWDARLCPTAAALVAGDSDAVDAFEEGKRVLREVVERVKTEIAGKRKRD